jgi:hypothetical protein
MADERDWVAVVGGGCDECGYEASAPERERLADALEDEAERWAAVLGDLAADGGTALRARPAEDVWSALEYAAHTRDVFAVFDGRIGRILAEDEPELGWWDHDAAVLDEAYNEQDPDDVAAALVRNARSLATSLRSVDDAGWHRAGTRRGSERFTVEGIGRYALHESRHHRGDAERVAGA